MLERLYTTDRKYYGYVLIEGETLQIYKSNTINHQLLNNLSVKRQNHHNKGGQSAPRFQRKIQGQELAFIKTVAKLINKSYLQENIPTIEGIIIAGPGEMKNKVLESSDLSPILKALVLTTMTTTELSEDTFLKVITDSMEYLNDADLKQEKQWYADIQEFMRTTPDRVLFGDEILNALAEGLVQYIYISEHKQEDLAMTEINGCISHAFSSHLLDSYGGIVAITWY